MDVRAYNREAWDRGVEQGDRWTEPVGPEVIAAARRGEWSIRLSEVKPAPREWFPELKGLEVLCLASGGGQQAPTLAAAGARVTVLDNSPKQLAQDRFVAERDGLDLVTVEGDMADLSQFADESFGLVYHTVSNLFVPDVRKVWRECFRVLRRGGTLLAGFLNPVVYVFDTRPDNDASLEVRHRIPYSDLTSLPDEERRTIVEAGLPLEFGHTLADQIGGQTDAGFHIVGFYEDVHEGLAMAKYIPTYCCTRALKP